MPLTRTSMPVGGGRTVDVVASDPVPSRTAVFYHHGTPGAAAHYAPWVEEVVGAGLRWVSFSRPGYGRSSRRPGRSVADNCTDVAAVLDALGVTRFVAMGASGGGPHSLACGALLAPRCAAAVSIAGVAPYLGAEAAGLEWLAGMGPENHAEFAAALEGESGLRTFLAPAAAELAAISGDRVGAALGGLVDAPDLAVLTGEYADHVAGNFHEAVRSGVDGWLDDDLAFTRDWGFRPADVQVPVSLWQGDADRMVPFAHGQFLVDVLPDVRAHLLPGQGHLSISLGMFDRIVADAVSLLG